MAAAADSSRFDGKWGVILGCPKAADGARPFTFEFTAAVRQGNFHGEHGVAGRPGWLALDGRIQLDGTANLAARGLTGDPHYNINQTAQAVPYEYDVSARFDARQGAGNWRALQKNGQIRVCDFTFTRQ